MDIVDAIVTNNKCYQAAIPLVPRGLMLHSIGTPQPSAAVLARYFDQYQPGGQSVCVHAFAQADGTVYQTLPWEMRGWHCGGSANNTHIGVEMTEPGAGTAYAEAAAQITGTYRTAVALFARLCETYGLDPLADGVITDEKLNFILEMRAKDPMHCKPYADKFGCEFVAGEKCWGVKDVDVYMPAAMQNDVKMESAEKIAASGVKYYIEVANMPTTNEALNFLRQQKHIIVAPSKAVNAGGVGVSALEMSQNSERLVWTADEVDHQLHKMMENIHKVSAEAAEEYGLGYDLVAGANIAGFKKVAEAMMEQGCF